MAMFCVKLAGIPIGVSAAYESTKDFCKEYLTDETPLISVAIEQSDIEKMRIQDRKAAIAEGRTQYDYPDSYLETLALAYVALGKLIDHNVVMFHGSVLAENGKAYVFTAPSGTGKTTHSRLWLKNFPECHILNGDKPLIMFKDGRIYACGSPWQGKENFGVNEIMPVEAMCIIGRDGKNHIEEITLKDGFDTFIRQFHIPEGSMNFITAVDLIKKFSNIKLFRLGCNMDDEAAYVSHGAMVK